jgi:DNA-binding transcriptional MerR regulator
MRHDAALRPGEILLTTKDVAKRKDRTPETVREWARAGRLKPVVVLSSGQRLFSAADVDRLD